MSYELEMGEAVGVGIKRIAHEQVAKAIEQLTDASADQDEAVHDARKRFKKIRALLRLVHAEIGEDCYKRENTCYRNAGRQLAAVRDSQVMVETLDDLMNHFDEQVDEAGFAVLRQRLVAAHDATMSALRANDTVTVVVAEIRVAQQRIDSWPINEHDYAALAGGLQRVYKRGKHGLQSAYADPDPDVFHEWRKRVKYLWYHLRILRPIWPALVEQWVAEMHRLANQLGDHHDLAELEALLKSDEWDAEAGKAREKVGSASNAVQTLLALSEQRRDALAAAAKPLGQRIYAEKPKAFARRIEAYWDAYAAEVAQG